MCEVISTVMPVECAWCKKKMGVKDGKGVIGETSTICGECVETYFPEQAEEFKKQKERSVVNG